MNGLEEIIKIGENLKVLNGKSTEDLLFIAAVAIDTAAIQSGDPVEKHANFVRDMCVEARKVFPYEKVEKEECDECTGSDRED